MIKNLRETEYGREGKADCNLCGCEIDVFIPDEEVTEEYANKCIENLNSLAPETVDIICKAAKAYFFKMLEEVGEDDLEDMTVPITADSSNSDIMKCFCVSTIMIEEPEDETRIAYRLECGCDWEIEHGMEIDILDGTPVYVGPYEEVSPWKEIDTTDEWNFINAI